MYVSLRGEGGPECPIRDLRDLFNSAGTNQHTYASSNPAKVYEYTAQTPRYRQ